ncbi:MAG: gluconate 2-dehydrogenase subunit 3 family protein [Myxococcaceae bacterium]
MSLPPPPLVPPDPSLEREAQQLQGQREAKILQGGFSRRSFLRAGGIGGGVFVLGAWAYRTFWRLGSPARGRQCLNDEEAVVADAVGEAFFPGKPEVPFSAAEVQLTDFVDGHVGGMYEDNQRLFKVLFRALNIFAFFSHGKSFARLTLAQRQAALDGWRFSALAARRAGYQSLRLVFGLGYFEDVRVRRALGFRWGCDLGES